MDSVLVIDDEKNVRALLTKILGQEQIEVHTAATGNEGLQMADDVNPEIVLLDIRLPDANGLDLLKSLKTRHPETAVIMITAYGEIASAVEAMKHGATDYLEKPFEPLDKLRLAIGRVLDEVKARREIHRLHQLQADQYGADRLIGESEATRHLREMIRQLAKSEAQTILILGESGTGKELVAKGLHYEGPRRDYPFMEVNCAAITETLFESELFGHEKGSFTDAKATKKGLMELADQGTLFLDEVSEMAPGSQAKLLRSLQERVVRRVGGTRDIKVDVRIIAATNRALENLVKEGKFREDLFYRLNVIPITIPPLRARREDIIPLARHFLLDLNGTFHKAIKGFVPETEKLLLNYAWPGNVRELKNLIERLVILTTSDYIEPAHLPPPFGLPIDGPLLAQTPDTIGRLSEVERAYILQAVQRAKGNKSLAAKMLGISRQTLRKKLEGG
jgi:DNA-binding NtrC family response regulator